MGCLHCFVDSSQANPEHCVATAQRRICSADFRCQCKFQYATVAVPVVATPICDVFHMFQVGKCIQVCNWLLGRVQFITLCGLNTVGWAAHCQICLACILKVFRMVLFDMFKWQAVWWEHLSAWKCGATESSLHWHCQHSAGTRLFTVEMNQCWCWAWAAWCVSLWYCPLRSEIFWASTPPRWDSYHINSYNNAAWEMSHSTMDQLKPIQIL